MYKIDAETDEIIFPDGYRLAPPYEDEGSRYLEYAAWVQAGNSPEMV